jgi:glycine dehydrogenase subunit 1
MPRCTTAPRGLAEAVLMAVRANKHCQECVVCWCPHAVHPHYRAALKAIVTLQDIEVVEVEFNKQGGHVDLSLR